MEYIKETRVARKHERYPTDVWIKIYSSFVPGSYTVNIKNYSQTGFFVQSKHLPKIGETITFEVLDSRFRPIFTSNAVVRWIKSDGVLDERGFGVQMFKDLGEKIHHYFSC